jgi:benzoyl-CoA reductase/2-hydroxyglutaryl-CoA dehydratase subunit BcrC/BadD/HgdB
METLANRAKSRPAQLKAKKRQGVKLIGHTGRFVPEEIIIAGGAIPFYLCRGGEPEPPEAVLPYLLRFMDPFSRAQIGYHLLGMDPVMPMLDLVVAQCEDCHMTRLADMLEYFKLPTLKLGVPPDWGKQIARDYYYRRLLMLKEAVESQTGIVITDERLKGAIIRLNRIRDLLRQIGELRRSSPPPISGGDVIRLHHISFYLDDDELIPLLEELLLERRGVDRSMAPGRPRILLAGNVVASGDYVIPQLIEETGADIVAEFMDRGHRYADWNVNTDGDLLSNLCDTYYRERIPPSVFQPSWEERLMYLQRLTENYRVDGVIWYQLAFNELHNLECSCIAKEMEAIGLPFLKLESAYENTRESMGPLITRIESFVASIPQRG